MSEHEPERFTAVKPLTARIAAYRAFLHDCLAMCDRASAKYILPTLLQRLDYEPEKPGGLVIIERHRTEFHVYGMPCADATFIAAARTGWPESIDDKLVMLDALEKIALCDPDPDGTRVPDDSYLGRIGSNALLVVLDKWEKGQG